MICVAEIDDLSDGDACCLRWYDHQRLVFEEYI